MRRFSMIPTRRIPVAAMALVLLGAASSAPASILIDFDMTGRALAEGQETGYTEWAVTEASEASMTKDGVTFSVARNGGAGTAIKSYYYKVGVQSPNYARLVCDALSVVGGDDGASIRVKISGLSSGQHSLLVYHNGIDGKQHGNIKVVVNGTTAIASQAQTNQVLSTDKAAYSYVTFSGTSATIDYTSLGSGSYKNVFLNNLSLDVPDPGAQAVLVSPGNGDWHADADAGSVTLSWKAASGAKTHGLYLGNDSAAVVNATATSPLYMGALTSTSYNVSSVTPLKYYFWRVDETNASGVTTKGGVWSFSPRRLAFPGAEGYGRYARGGRGGKVVHVTNLNDAGTGSFRDAVENQTGARTIVFDVAGLITLQSRLVQGDPFVTVAGQTAPGKGICFRTNPLGFTGTDQIVRFMKMRLGGGATNDGMGMTGADYSIMDHSSISWTVDEAFSSRSARNITLQRTLISEALNVAGHDKKPDGTGHGYAGTISGNTASYHHNLGVHNAGRNFSMGSAIDGAAVFNSKLEISNNVFYNWYDRATDGQAHEVNFIGNYYKMGPATKLAQCLSMDYENYATGTMTAWYANNILQAASGSFTCNGKDNTCGRKWTTKNGDPGPTNEVFPTSGPLFPSYIVIQPAAEAYKDVISDVGMNMPTLDDHDVRVINEAYTGTYKYKGSVTGFAGIPDEETDVGGYESYPNTTRATDFDTDGDGLPNWYEKLLGTNTSSAKNDFSDANADADGNLYTNLEDYLEYMATPHAEAAVGSVATFDLAALFKGYEKTTPSYRAGANACVTTSLSGPKLSITPKSACGIAYLPVTVTDKESSTKTRMVALYVTGSVPTGVHRAVAEPQWRIEGGRYQFLFDGAGALSLRDVSGRQDAVIAVKAGEWTVLPASSGRMRIAVFECEGLRRSRILMP